MKVGVLAPLFNSIPPKKYGGTELIASQITEGLTAKGHDVTLFASGDSQTAARLVPIVPEGFNGDTAQNFALITQQLIEAYVNYPDIEVWSSHIAHVPMALAPFVSTPLVTTLHGVWLPERQSLYELASKWAYFVSISKRQQSFYKNVRFLDTVYNGVDTSELALGEGAGGYFVWIGRFAAKKGPVEAIEIAEAAGVPLKLAAPLRPAPEPDEAFFNEFVKPRLTKAIEYIGAVGGREKVELLQNARGLISPLLWEEPFGLVAAEAMSCGTPVLTTKMGAMPELVVHGKTGFLADTADELTQYIDQLDALDRPSIRQHAVDHFSVERMVEGYERVYQAAINNRADLN